VPAELFERVLAAGAQVVSSREVVRRLEKAGLRKRKRRLGAG
jgi:hypothetical protein